MRAWWRRGGLLCRTSEEQATVAMVDEQNEFSRRRTLAAKMARHTSALRSSVPSARAVILLCDRHAAAHPSALLLTTSYHCLPRTYVMISTLYPGFTIIAWYNQIALTVILVDHSFASASASSPLATVPRPHAPGGSRFHNVTPPRWPSLRAHRLRTSRRTSSPPYALQCQTRRARRPVTGSACCFGHMRSGPRSEPPLQRHISLSLTGGNPMVLTARHAGQEVDVPVRCPHKVYVTSWVIIA